MNQNVEILERFILAALDSKYKESPPSEEQFIEIANSLRESNKKLIPVLDDEYTGVLRRLRANVVISMDVGIFIDDRNSGHKSWLPASRADVNFFFWNRYKNYLEINKNWNTRVTASLDRVSDEIVDLLGNPQSSVVFQRRGLVLGDVQSGKTANYTAICNKAADTGYRIIIILAGMLENLRTQTQGRMDAEFAGRKSEYYLNPSIEQEIKNQPVGVGRYGVDRRIASFTSVVKDFDINVLRSNNLALQNVHDPVLLVVKKNEKILSNLINWLIKNNADHNGKINLPLLLIDDEADNASVNTKKEEDSPAAINTAIRKLLNCFYQASYLGITATPFANIFIDPDTESEMLGEDLFPRDFIYALSPPTNYIGADAMFGDEPQFEEVLEPISMEEIESFFPFTHKKELVVSELQPSLYEALAYFVLVNGVRDYRGDHNAHRSMMIHISRFTNVQNQIAEIVNEWIVRLRSDLQNYSKLEENTAIKIPTINFLFGVWVKYELEKLAKITWPLFLKTYLYRAIAPIDVRAVNQSTGSSSLDYFVHKEDGLRVIAVGGNSLSRGLTLEGLCVSYFYRRSQMYDTLLQMGRWFGFRPNYEDLIKLWISKEAIDWYGYITMAANEFKKEIIKMKNANQTPKDFGLKVRQDPNSLIATARNKMRSATAVKRPITVSGRLLETPRLKADRRILESNENAFKDFIKELDNIGKRRSDQGLNFWEKVPKDAIAQLLLDFETHPWHLAFQGRALSEYITEKMADEYWDVVIAEGKGDQYVLDCANEEIVIKSEHRKVLADSKMIRISGTKVRVGAGGSTKIGLTDKEIKIVQSQSRGKNVSDSAYLIKGRKPILMLHIIDVVLDDKESTNLDVPKFLFALGVGFPDTGSEMKTANYVVNVVELRNWMDIDEEDFEL